jgi:hypothetical protein
MPAHEEADRANRMDANLLGELTAIGWRAFVLALIALLVIYALISWVRLRRVARLPVAATASGADVAALDAAPPAEREALLAAMVERQRLDNLEEDLARTRQELNALRAAFTALREDFEQRSESMSTHLKAAQHVSPIYGDAMQMALAGEEVATISERCGIARAEAELVVALVHRREGEMPAEEGVDGGGDGEQSRY